MASGPLMSRAPVPTFSLLKDIEVDDATPTIVLPRNVRRRSLIYRKRQTDGFQHVDSLMASKNDEPNGEKLKDDSKSGFTSRPVSSKNGSARSKSRPTTGSERKGHSSKGKKRSKHVQEKEPPDDNDPDRKQEHDTQLSDQIQHTDSPVAISKVQQDFTEKGQSETTHQNSGQQEATDIEKKQLNDNTKKIPGKYPLTKKPSLAAVAHSAAFTSDLKKRARTSSKHGASPRIGVKAEGYQLPPMPSNRRGREGNIDPVVNGMKCFGIGKNGIARAVVKFSSPPTRHPNTLCFHFPATFLTHRYVLDMVRSKIHFVPEATVKTIQYIDRNTIHGTQGLDNRWLITVSNPEGRDELLRLGLHIYNRRITLRRYDDILLDEYREYQQYQELQKKLYVRLQEMEMVQKAANVQPSSHITSMAEELRKALGMKSKDKESQEKTPSPREDIPAKTGCEVKDKDKDIQKQNVKAEQENGLECNESKIESSDGVEKETEDEATNDTGNVGGEETDPSSSQKEEQ